MILEKLLILLQLLILIVFISTFYNRTNFVGKYYSPYNWFAFFIFFWFIAPQILAVNPPYHLVGLVLLGDSSRANMVIHGQLAVVTFILSFSTSYFLSRYLFLKKNAVEQNFHYSFIKGVDFKVLLIFYLIGVLCIFKLGITFQNIEGMRSQLVKTIEGQLLTAVSFFGNFAFSVLFSYFFIRRKFTFAFIVLLVFASAILLTGARGRLLWPLLLSFIFISIYYRKFPAFKISILGAVMILILVLLDPLMISIRSGDISNFFIHLKSNNVFEALFLKRNFDSFSNLSLIVYFDEVTHEWIRLFTGARNAFMEHYYPAVYKSGVGFGVTYPGTAFLSGGWIGLILVGSIFGMVCGLISLRIEQPLSIPQMFAYLVLMPWLCASGGNFIENFDKMLVAVFPAYLWLFMRKVRVK